MGVPLKLSYLIQKNKDDIVAGRFDQRIEFPGTKDSNFEINLQLKLLPEQVSVSLYDASSKTDFGVFAETSESFVEDNPIFTDLKLTDSSLVLRGPKVGNQKNRFWVLAATGNCQPVEVVAVANKATMIKRLEAGRKLVKDYWNAGQKFYDAANQQLATLNNARVFSVGAAQVTSSLLTPVPPISFDAFVAPPPATGLLVKAHINEELGSRQLQIVFAKSSQTTSSRRAKLKRIAAAIQPRVIVGFTSKASVTTTSTTSSTTTTTTKSTSTTTTTKTTSTTTTTKTTSTTTTTKTTTTTTTTRTTTTTTKTTTTTTTTKTTTTTSTSTTTTTTRSTTSTTSPRSSNGSNYSAGSSNSVSSNSDSSSSSSAQGHCALIPVYPEFGNGQEPPTYVNSCMPGPGYSGEAGCNSPDGDNPTTNPDNDCPPMQGRMACGTTTDDSGQSAKTCNLVTCDPATTDCSKNDCENSEKCSTCCFCFYDDDPNSAIDCDKFGKENKNSCLSFTSAHIKDYSSTLSSTCCEKYNILVTAHNYPNCRNLAIAECAVLEPNCQSCNVIDRGCETFGEMAVASARAEQLRRLIAACGKTGLTVHVEGEQNWSSPNPTCKSTVKIDVCVDKVDIAYPPCHGAGEGCWTSRNGDNDTITCMVGGVESQQKCTPKPGCAQGEIDCAKGCCENGTWQAPSCAIAPN